MHSNWKNYLEKALKVRAPLFERGKADGTDSFRLFCGDAEGLAGLVIDQYGPVIILNIYENECQLSQQELAALSKWLLLERKAKSVYKKQFIKDRTQTVAGDQYYSADAFVGEKAPEKTLCYENGLGFEIQPYSGFSTGLFLDQRENRLELAKRASQKKVLNLFAYTCAFSVACAARGASVTSVDLSKKYLEWGKRNFEKNSIDLKEHRFIAKDAMEFLQKEFKRKNVYDLVIVDPPSFSRTKAGGVFSIKKDLEKLLEAAALVVAPGGLLFFSCNFADWNTETLKKKSQAILEKNGDWSWEKDIQRPTDFTNAAIPISQWMASKES